MVQEESTDVPLGVILLYLNLGSKLTYFGVYMTKGFGIWASMSSQQAAAICAARGAMFSFGAIAPVKSRSTDVLDCFSTCLITSLLRCIFLLKSKKTSRKTSVSG